MTPQELWNDRTFFTLLTDVWKARKDSELGPVRLQVLLSYVGANGGIKPATMAPSVIQAPTREPNTNLLESEKIKVDEVATEKEAAGPVERMIKKIQEYGAKANGQPFNISFTPDEGQAVQEIGAYLEKFNIPYRLVPDPFGNEKAFDPQSRTWRLRFAKR